MNRYESPYSKVVSSVVAAGLGASMLAGCTSGSHKETSVCENVGFGSMKGGPGSIVMDVYPIMKQGSNAQYGFGKVVGGNDRGEPIAWNNSGGSPHGEFVFTFDPNTKEVQSSKVEFSVVTETTGNTQQCPTTTVRFDQERDLITPTYK